MTGWPLFFTIAAAQGLFLAAAMFFKPENRRANRLLAAFLVLLAVTLAEWVLWWTGLIGRWPGFRLVSVPFPLLYGPLLWMFYRTTLERSAWRLRDGLHFLPALILAALLAPFYLRFVLPDADLARWSRSVLASPAFPVLVFTHLIGYAGWIPYRFRARLRDRGDLLRWHRWLLAAYCGIILCYVAYRLLSFLEGPFPAWKYLIALGLTVYVYGLAWIGYLHPRLLAGWPLSEAVKPEKYRRSSLRPERSEALFSGVEALMREEGWYKNSGLTLDDLARRLQTGRHHVSQAINEQSGKTYAEYVNDYRIREAKRLLTSTSKREMNVIEVAFQSGFSTKKAFNLAFRKATGRTPTIFREEARKTV